MGNPFEIPAESEAKSRFVQLTVSDQHGKEVLFKIKRATELSKLIHMYCQRQRVSPQDVKFLYARKALLPSHTPDLLGMADVDYLRVVDNLPHSQRYKDGAVDLAVPALEDDPMFSIGYVGNMPQAMPTM
eukprot:TRINITY_DN2223_c0_g1_i1.p1 TRINITY_DN2223_c0_g1~~TRINITY_DN2223_c0_g1_i1.p1  ORF type:complete len:130 (+),score=18.59 TRINITY_DN2223_c0_g1_i1:332-721(+)